MKTILLVLLILWLLAGCGPAAVTAPSFVDDVQLEHPEYAVQYDISGLPDVVQYAAEQWNTAEGCDLFVLDCSDCPKVFIEEAVVATSAEAFHRDDTGDCGIEYNREDMDFYQLWEHELGHCLGLGHSSLRESIMYPIIYLNKTQTIPKWYSEKGHN